MLRITSPYIRETAVLDEKEGKAVVIKIEPPGLTIDSAYVMVARLGI